MKISPRTITYLLICGGILFASGFVVIYEHKNIKEKDAEISKIKAQIDQQKILSPVFKDLIKRSRVKDPVDLPFPKKEKLSRDDTEKVLSVFQEIAARSNLKIKSYVPDVESLADGSEQMMMDVVLNGDFFDFQKFFMQLGELPYLEHIERFKIKSVKGTKEISLRIWMAQG
jgi:hypothetical protein